jgi:aspartyl-tRNA(Asn)/glutamyl-tRNA(Gln) amidotransferase subunit A
VPFGLAETIDVRELSGMPGRTARPVGPPERDATVTTRLAEQGAILAGTLRVLPFAGAGGPPEAPGSACRSPWDSGRAAGGPSPGAAAAVAAGLVSFAIGALGAEPDTAAGECGVTSLRPTYGVLSRRGALLGSFTLATLGVVARSAEDCALVLDALAGADPRDPSSLGPPLGIGRLAPELPRGLRVGVLDFSGPQPDAPHDSGAGAEAWAGAHEALRAAGAIVAPVALPDLPWTALAALLDGAEATVIREDVLGLAPDPERGPSGASAADYVRAARLRGEAQRVLARLFERHDLLLAPAPRAGSATAGDPLSAAVALGGLPALTLPVGLAGGRPVAARLVAPPLEESRLLTTAAIFQARTTHHLRRPTGLAAPPLASVTAR